VVAAAIIGAAVAAAAAAVDTGMRVVVATVEIAGSGATAEVFAAAENPLRFVSGQLFPKRPCPVGVSAEGMVFGSM